MPETRRRRHERLHRHLLRSRGEPSQFPPRSTGSSPAEKRWQESRRVCRRCSSSERERNSCVFPAVRLFQIVAAWGFPHGCVCLHKSSRPARVGGRARNNNAYFITTNFFVDRYTFEEICGDEVSEIGRAHV